MIRREPLNPLLVTSEPKLAVLNPIGLPAARTNCDKPRAIEPPLHEEEDDFVQSFDIRMAEYPPHAPITPNRAPTYRSILTGRPRPARMTRTHREIYFPTRSATPLFSILGYNAPHRFDIPAQTTAQLAHCNPNTLKPRTRIGSRCMVHGSRCTPVRGVFSCHPCAKHVRINTSSRTWRGPCDSTILKAPYAFLPLLEETTSAEKAPISDGTVSICPHHDWPKTQQAPPNTTTLSQPD